MPPPSLAVGHLNVHNRSGAVRAALGVDCDVWGFNEAGTRRRQLAGRRRYRLHMAPPIGKGRDLRMVGDCATVVRTRLPYLGGWCQQVSQQVDSASRVAPDRFIVVAVFRWRGLRVAHFNVHLNAGPAVRSRPASPVTREYGESVQWLDRMVGLYRGQGYAVLVSGDFNLPELDVPWSPWLVLARHGLDWHRKHIDGIAWSTDHFKPRHRQVFDKARMRSDHPALRVVLEVAA